MPDRDTPIEAGERGCQHGRGVALHERQSGLHAGEQLVARAEQASRELGERLVGAHHGQVMLNAQAEQAGYLVQHFPVLAGADHDGVEVGSLLERPDHGRQLDGFRAGAEKDGNASGRHPS
jgi:hypothetical protein